MATVLFICHLTNSLSSPVVQQNNIMNCKKTISVQVFNKINKKTPDTPRKMCRHISVKNKDPIDDVFNSKIKMNAVSDVT